MEHAETRRRRVETLRAQGCLNGFDQTEIEALAREVWECRYAGGQIVFQQGDDCTSLFIVVQGSVELSFCSRDGREVIVAEARAGDIVGEVELVLGIGRLTNALASEGTQVLVLGRATFQTLLRNQAFALATIQAISTQWCRLAHFAESMSLHSMERRLAGLLVELCRTHGKPVQNGVMIDRAISQSRIGQMINASRPKINGRLQSWKDSNVISFNRNRIVVLNRKALEQIANR